jgi:hypothetical protein
MGYTAFKFCPAMVYYIFANWTRGRVWDDVREEVLNIFYGDGTTDDGRLLDMFKPCYESPLSAEQTSMINRLFQNQSRTEIFNKCVRPDFSSVGCFADPSFTTMLGEVSNTDYQNHGIRFSVIEPPGIEAQARSGQFYANPSVRWQKFHEEPDDLPPYDEITTGCTLVSFEAEDDSGQLGQAQLYSVNMGFSNASYAFRGVNLLRLNELRPFQDANINRFIGGMLRIPASQLSRMRTFAENRATSIVAKVLPRDVASASALAFRR